MLDKNAINSHILKLTGKAEIPEPLKIGFNYKTEIQGTCEGINEEDNHDGTHNYYYKFEPVLVELIKETGERIKAKDTRRKSQMLRSCIWKEWQETQVNQEFEDYYDNRMTEIIRKIIEGEL